jgi:UrcA family protein
VTYGDLNLATEAGASALYARIVSAAREVCASESIDIRDLGAFTHAKACESTAVAAAVNAVHHPRLASVYREQVRHG